MFDLMGLLGIPSSLERFCTLSRRGDLDHVLRLLRGVAGARERNIEGSECSYACAVMASSLSSKSANHAAKIGI